MPLTFDGHTITGGIVVASGATDSSHGSAGGVKATLKSVTSLGASIDPFNVDFEGDGCNNCVPGPGDWITATAGTIVAIDITTWEWSLCGGRCRGRKTTVGFSLGLEIKNLKWTF
jgi:hypothetical protein